jgi:predicted phosphodiesterase
MRTESNGRSAGASLGSCLMVSVLAALAGQASALPLETVAGLADDTLRAGANRFTVVALPDTQNYSEFYPQIYKAQTEWVVRNQRKNNIRFVSHVGDVVNHGDRDFEWKNSKAAMKLLENANIPYGVTAGNHDITPSGVAGSSYIPQKYLEYYGPQNFAGRDWYKGASPSGMSNYQTFKGGGRDFLIMHLACDTPVAELAWAQGVLNRNRDKAVILTTHRYLQDAEDYTGGVPIVPSGRYPDIWYGFEGVYHPDGMRSEEFFQSFVRKQKNVFMVHCGHFHEEYRQSSVGVHGQVIHEVLHDYQDDPNGGNGYLRLMEFDLAGKRVDMKSYSPTLDNYLTKDESQFSLAVDFDKYRTQNKVRVFQQGVNGYNGTQDTWISEEDKNTSYGGNQTIIIDDDVNNSIFSDRRGQGLLKFDGVIGSGPDQVPSGSLITKATLSMTLADDIDFVYDPQFYVFMMTRDWNESSTWNSLSGGLTQGSDYGILLGEFSGDNLVDSDFFRMVDVTAAVQAWADGAPNFGFAIITQVISGNDDGIEIWSSEAGNILYRPWLDVEYADGLVPSPGVSAVMIAGLAMVGRRRRA